MTLTYIAIGQAVAFPILFAAVLVLLIRRSANAWGLALAFLFGMLGAFSLHQSILRNLPSMLPEDHLKATSAGQAWLSGFVDASIPEELSKGVWIIVLLIGWRQYTLGHGALIGGLVGLGFALRENLAYAQTVPEWRILGALSHGEWGVIMGSLLQCALSDSARRFRIAAGAFLAPIMLHGLLDASIFLVDAYEAKNGINPMDPLPAEKIGPGLVSAMLMTVVMEIVSLVWAIRLIRSVRRSPVITDKIESAER